MQDKRYINGGYRPYGPPSCLNYGQSNLTSTKLQIKDPMMLMCVWISFIHIWVREVMLYFTIHDLTIQEFNNTLLKRDFGI